MSFVKPQIVDHAMERAMERFGLDGEELRLAIERGKAHRLNATRYARGQQGVRSAYLLYLVSRDEFCMVIQDDRNRAIITVLTFEMAMNSVWGPELTEVALLRARKMADERIDEGQVLAAQIRMGGSKIQNLRIRTFSWDWRSCLVNLTKLSCTADQIDALKHTCTLTDAQLAAAREAFDLAVQDKRIRPYGELFLANSKNRVMPVSNVVPWLKGIQDGELAMRWGDSE